MKGALIVISGPSGVGKDTVIRAWMDRNPRIVKIITHTTRPAKAHEEHGVDYWFETPESFEEKANNGTFLEHEGFFDKRYASPRAAIDEAVAEGKLAVLNIDVNGARRVRALRHATLVFIAPPNRDALLERLRARGRETPEEIEKRMARAQYEMDASHEFDFVVENAEVERAVAALEAIADRVASAT